MIVPPALEVDSNQVERQCAFECYIFVKMEIGNFLFNVLYRVFTVIIFVLFIEK